MNCEGITALFIHCVTNCNNLVSTPLKEHRRPRTCELGARALWQALQGSKRKLKTNRSTAFQFLLSFSFAQLMVTHKL